MRTRLAIIGGVLLWLLAPSPGAADDAPTTPAPGRTPGAATPSPTPALGAASSRPDSSPPTASSPAAPSASSPSKPGSAGAAGALSAPAAASAPKTATTPKPAVKAAGKSSASKKEPEPEPLPPAEARLWVIAPSPTGKWTFRIDNTSARPIRIPADVRLLELEVEQPSVEPSVDDSAAEKRPARKKQKPKKAKPVRCAAPDNLRPSGFPESRALLLAPGESYVEAFNPKLFCFGKAADELKGGAIVRSRFGWKPPAKPAKASKKPPAGPFAVDGTDYPPVFAPLYELRAPTIVLSYGEPRGATDADRGDEAGAGARPAGTAAVGSGAGAAAALNSTGVSSNAIAVTAASPGISPAAGAATAPGGAAGADKNAKAKNNSADSSDGSRAQAPTGAPAETDAPAAALKSAPQEGRAGEKDAAPGTQADEKNNAGAPAVVDANAARLELSSSPYIDAAAERNVSLTVTAKNAGRRPMLAVLRPRMLELRIHGPGGETVCPADSAPRGVPRDMFKTYKPGDAATFTMLLAEVCPRTTFARPGLYRVTPTLHAEESGSDPSVVAYTATVHATSPTLVRVLTGTQPFYVEPPRAIPTPRQTVTDDDAAAAIAAPPTAVAPTK